MKTTIFFIPCVLFFSFSFSLHARDFVIVGNNRTQAAYIEHLINKCKQNESPDLSQCLMNSELFSKVDIKEFDNKTLVEVEERWTLIPVPEVKVSSDSSTYGGYLVERNFLGRGKLAVLGGSLGSDSNSYMFFYKDRDLFYSNWIFEFLASKSDRDQEAYNQTDVRLGFNEKDTLFKTGIGYRLVPEIEASIAISYQDLKFKQLDQFTPPSNYNSNYYELELKYNNTNYKFYFNEGVSGYFIYAKQFNRSDREKNLTKDFFGINYQKNIWLKHALQLGMNAIVISNSNSKDLEKIGSSPSLRGVQDRGLWTDKTLTLSVDYQIPLSSPSYGTWTMAPFWDYGIYESPYTEKRNFRAYGLGGYLYLKQIALPGIGLVAGKNNRFDGNFVSFSVGLGRGR